MSNSSALCIDASVVIRIVTSDAATNLWESWMADEIKIVAPSLLYYEVTNGLYRYYKAGIYPPEAVETTLRAALALPIELVTVSDLHPRAKEIAMRYNLPATYDAHYLALAEWMEIDLWTADMRLVNSLKPFKVKWVKGIE
jgi:predicted nucleic acid-binding protein